jgi:NitT/TauT family transport system substrate-binding protein
MKVFSLIAGMLLILGSCQNPAPQKQTDPETAEAKGPDTLRLAFDWRPNALHSGILLAQKRGWYDSLNLALDWFTPEVDQYQKKPIWRLQDGEVDLAIGPTEHIFRYGAATDTTPEKAVQAIATILQDDLSAFVTKPGSGLDRPRKLDGARYGGYHTPLEQAILRDMIQNNGGKGQFDLSTPPRLSVWEAFKRDSVDLCWVFLHWEATQWALAQDTSLNTFIPNDYGVPYGYSSVFFAPAQPTARQERLYRRFLAATARGYRAVATHPKQAAGELLGAINHENYQDSALLRASFQRVAPALLQEGQWGRQATTKYRRYLRWVKAQNLWKSIQALRSEDVFTNRYLVSVYKAR